MAARKKAVARRKATRRKRSLAPREVARGPEALETPLALDAPEVAPLVEHVRALGGAAVGAYREPCGASPILFAIVPVGAVEPTPFQRDLSPAHVERLAGKIDEVGAFLDPLIAVRAPPAHGREPCAPGYGNLWTPNGRHRLAAARMLGMRSIALLLCADEGLAYRILALNTEKAHTLRDRSLEVIRMARALAAARPRERESDHAAELESAALLTLGAVYERDKRFAGGAYHPMLRRVDAFSSKPLSSSLRERDDWAARLLEIDARVRELIALLQSRGFRSPYLRNYIVARLDPARPAGRGRAARKPSMSLPAALTRLAANARKFDPASVHMRDLALVAAVAAEPEPA
jgi:ParB family chromosome partitioning protein